MVQLIPVPDLEALLPPLLACLATASASLKPPPAISLLLSPILRQRVLLLSDPSPSESWVPLLCWNSDKASQLLEIVRTDRFELHPVSGEVECKDIDPVQFRKLDEETVHAKVVLKELELVVVYLWCVGDVEGCGDGWRVAEVTVFDGGQECKEKWYDSVSAADQTSLAAPLQPSTANGKDMRDYHNAHDRAVDNDNGDDDAYWRQYDGISAPQTPPPPQLPSPTFYNIVGSNGHRRVASEEEYFARYAQVQSTLDNDDDNREPATFEYKFERAANQHLNKSSACLMAPTTQRVDQTSLPEPPSSISRYASTGNIMESPFSRPLPSFSSSSSVVARLEETAALGFWVDTGVKQHISASIKSLFRVARVAGIGYEKFARLLKNELRGSVLLEDDGTRGPYQYISSCFYGLLRPARMAGIDAAEIERIVTTELTVLEMIGDEDTGIVGAS